MIKLPKLYRVVYLEIEWITDTCEGGEHIQRGGVYYTPVRLVINKGVKIWQTLDPNFNDQYFERDDLDYDWHSHDLELAEYMEENRHNPMITRESRTIKQQKQDEIDAKENHKFFAKFFK